MTNDERNDEGLSTNRSRDWLVRHWDLGIPFVISSLVIRHFFYHSFRHSVLRHCRTSLARISAAPESSP